MINLIPNTIEGSFVVDFSRFEDNRGYFQEIFSAVNYIDLNDGNEKFSVKQVNVSSSSKNVIRGLHVAPFAKLCTCIKGRIFDVVVDVRPQSKTFKSWFGIWLDEHDPRQLFVPSGCAHGFFSEEDGSMLLYAQNDVHIPGSPFEYEIRWNDPDLNVEWPVRDNYNISEKDRNAKFFNQQSIT